jgi:hypothetical protein
MSWEKILKAFDTPYHYVVQDELWESTNLKNKTITMDELEEILGRDLVLGDFKPILMNYNNPEVQKRIGIDGAKELALQDSGKSAQKWLEEE